MNDILDIDSPLAHYKMAFPQDLDAESKVLQLLHSTAIEVLGKWVIDLENIEQEGLSKLELDIYTNIKIDVLREEEMI